MTIGSTNSDENHHGGCSGNSFLIGDGVCDEITNVKKCLYDGGDCCREDKNTEICRKCTCLLSVDPEKLAQRMTDNQVGLYVFDNESLVQEPFEILIQVNEVKSAQVCAKLCLEAEAEATDFGHKIDSWIFFPRSSRLGYNESLCQCTKFQDCYQSYHFDLNINFTSLPWNQHLAMLTKLLPCGM